MLYRDVAQRHGDGQPGDQYGTGVVHLYLPDTPTIVIDLEGTRQAISSHRTRRHGRHPTTAKKRLGTAEAYGCSTHSSAAWCSSPRRSKTFAGSAIPRWLPGAM